MPSGHPLGTAVFGSVDALIEGMGHASAAHRMHHLEIRDVSVIDDEVAGWLRKAAERAS